MGWLEAASIAAPFVANLFGGKKSNSQGRMRGIYERYAGMRPTGYLTPEDYAFTERGRARGGEALGVGVNQARSEAIRRYAQRGIGGPAMERTLGRIGQGELEGRQNINRNAEDTLYHIRSGREQRQWGLMSQGMNLEAGGAMRDLQANDLRNSTFWNSMMEYMPNITSYFNGGGLPQGALAQASDYQYQPPAPR